MSKDILSQDEKIELFMSLFTGLKHVYGTYDTTTGRAYQVKALVGRNTIVGHLWGLKPYGVYLLVKDKTRAIAVDFDSNVLTPVIRFMTEAGRLGIPVHVERSKSKGYHLWMFFEHPVPASKARVIVHHILNKIGYPATEVFPKRDRLDEKVSFGNFINAPLFSLSVKRQKTVFVDPSNRYRPFKDQWQLLYNIHKTSEDQIDQLIEKLGLTTSVNVYSPHPQTSNNRRSYSHPPCIQEMLDQGVTENQRLACFHIGVSHWRIHAPFEEAVSILNAWAPKNRPRNGKRIITEKEIIAQTQSAYSGKYRSIGCECPSVMPFCDPNCPVRNKIR